MRTTFSTTGHDGPDRVALWHDVVCRTFVPLDVAAGLPETFTGSVASDTVGELQLTRVAAQPHVVRRTRTLIDRDDAAYAIVGLQLAGRSVVVQDDRQAALHVSVRYLHRIFEREEQTVAGLVRRRRLQACRRDLRMAGPSGRSAAAIGHRWGFADPAHFSGAFKAAYGVPPGRYRDEVAGPAARTLAGPRPGEVAGDAVGGGDGPV